MRLHLAQFSLQFLQNIAHPHPDIREFWKFLADVQEDHGPPDLRSLEGRIQFVAFVPPRLAHQALHAVAVHRSGEPTLRHIERHLAGNVIGQFPGEVLRYDGPRFGGNAPLKQGAYGLP